VRAAEGRVPDIANFIIHHREELLLHYHPKCNYTITFVLAMAGKWKIATNELKFELSETPVSSYAGALERFKRLVR
jgi:hypothetical protein